MGNFNLTITNEGAAFLADVIANQGTLDFTEVRFSSTNYVGVEASLTEGTFGGTFITAVPSASVVDTTTIKVGSYFDNSTFTTDKTLYSIGLIAEDGNGNTVLLAVCTTATPDTISKFISTTSMYAYNISLTESDTQNITVTSSAAGVLTVVDVIDNLSSTNTQKPLSANQGRILNTQKAAKPVSPTNGNLAGLDSHGDLTDSGIAKTEVVTKNASNILGAKIVANATAVATLGDSQVRNIYAGTTDLTPGVSPLPSGDIYIVYEP